MPYLADKLFTKEQRENIERAIHDAEVHTAGEVVPFVVEQSDDYDEAILRSVVLFGLLPLLAFDLIRLFTEVWLPLNIVDITMIVLASMVLGWVVGKYIAPWKRLLAGNALMDRRVAQRAAEAFIAEEVFKTRDRTGILIFTSVFEREVFVLADSGINARVNQEQWQQVVTRIVDGIKKGRLADGIIEGLKQCGNVLRASGIEAHPANTNELPNTLRTGK